MKQARLATLCLGMLVALLANADETPLRIVEVAPGVHMLMGRGGNIGVSSGADGLFLVDDQFATEFDGIRAALAEISDRPVRFLLNTHWHGDHSGGNEAFAEAGTLIFAHDNVRLRMSTEQFMRAMNRRVPASPEAALPVVTFGADLSFHWNEETIRAVHVPNAHTDGDAFVHFERANAIHAGDTYFANGFPFIDLSSGGSIDGLIAAVDRMLSIANEDTAIIPGHGELSDRAGLLDYRRMLRATRKRVAQAVSSGMTVEALVTEAPLADFEARWGQGFIEADAFLRSVHASLTQPR